MRTAFILFIAVCASAFLLIAGLSGSVAETLLYGIGAAWVLFAGANLL